MHPVDVIGPLYIFNILLTNIYMYNIYIILYIYNIYIYKNI